MARMIYWVDEPDVFRAREGRSTPDEVLTSNGWKEWFGEYGSSGEGMHRVEDPRVAFTRVDKETAKAVARRGDRPTDW